MHVALNDTHRCFYQLKTASEIHFNSLSRWPDDQLLNLAAAVAGFCTQESWGAWACQPGEGLDLERRREMNV